MGLTLTQKLGTILGVVLFVVAAFLFYKSFEAREAAQHSGHRGRAFKIGKAFLRFHDMNGSLPQAVRVNEKKSLRHSWRSAILQVMLNVPNYNDYVSWNSPTNLQCAAKCSKKFSLSTSLQEAGITSFVACSGPGTAFPENGKVTWDDFSDGLENTLLVIEAEELGIKIFEPRDLDIQRLNKICVNGFLPLPPSGRRILLFADGSYHTQLTKIPIDVLRALMTIAGGEPIDREELIERGLFD